LVETIIVRAAEEDGADWVELNFSCPQMRNEMGGHKVGQDVDLIKRFTAVAKAACSIPVVAKMTPNLTDMVSQALAAQRGGADAVRAVNTFKYILVLMWTTILRDIATNRNRISKVFPLLADFRVALVVP
jgi:dihydroorotate dehydrogenase